MSSSCLERASCSQSVSRTFGWSRFHALTYVTVAIGQIWDSTEGYYDTALTDNSLSRKWEVLLLSSTEEYYKRICAEDLSTCTAQEYIDNVSGGSER